MPRCLIPARWIASGLMMVGAFLLAPRLGQVAETAQPPSSDKHSENQPWVEYYVDAAEVAAIYGTAAEEITPEAAAKLLLDLTNQARADAGLSQLSWRDDAAQVAQAHSAEMTARRYISHYDLQGRKCELRYNDAGFVDQISENTAYYEIHHEVYLTPQLVKRMHQHWLESTSHRLNIMEQAHTHLGAGFAVARQAGVAYIAGTVEFVNDFGEYGRLPAEARPGQTLRLEGVLDPECARLAFIGIGSEDLPTARTVEYQMAHIGGYSPPDPALRLLPVADALAHTPDAWRYVRPIVQWDSATGKFTADIVLRANWPAAAYYVTVWAVPPGASTQEGTPDYAEAFSTMVQVVRVKLGSTFN